MKYIDGYAFGVLTTDPLTALLAEIDSKQQLVMKLVAAWPDTGWLARPNHPDLGVADGVHTRGHFVGREHQLRWSPAQIAAHLVGANEIATRHVDMIRRGATAMLPVLSELPPEPFATRELALRKLDESHQTLIFRAAGATAGELGLTGMREQRRVSLREVLMGIAEHDADHAHHLVVLLGGR